MASEKVSNVTDESFKAEVLDADTPVVVDFWAPWCGPCRAIAPILSELADEYDGRVKVVKVNSDESIETAAAYRIRSLPTVMVFNKGKAVNQLIGAAPKAKFKGLFDAVA